MVYNIIANGRAMISCRLRDFEAISYQFTPTKKRGHEALQTYYEKIAPSRFIGKPLYMFPQGKERSSRTYRGVRGSPSQLITAGVVYLNIDSGFSICHFVFNSLNSLF
jgi:hypothetical protein